MSPFMRVSALSAGCFIVLLGVTLVIASPISGSSNGANEGADVPRGNPLLEKALQRANYRLSQLPSDDYLSSLRDRIFFVRAPAFQRTSPFTRKRSCFINAGMGNNCDFKDLLSAASSRRLWQSGNSPGKRSGSLPTALSTAEYPSQSGYPMVKRMQCISGLPGGDCENSFLGGESEGQDFLRPGGRNPGRR